jgi:hypothetical protein
VTLSDQQRCHASHPHVKHPTVSFGLQARHRHDLVVDRSRYNVTMMRAKVPADAVNSPAAP